MLLPGIGSSSDSSGLLGVQLAVLAGRTGERLVLRARHVPVRTVDLPAPGCADAIVGREDPQQWGFKHLDQLWQAYPS